MYGAEKLQWYEGEVGVYFVNLEHPVVRGFSNFAWKDEIYYDLDMAPDAQVFGTVLLACCVAGRWKETLGVLVRVSAHD